MRRLLAPAIAASLALSNPADAASCFDDRAPLNSSVSVPHGDVTYHPSAGQAPPLVFFPEAHSYGAKLSPAKTKFNRALFTNMAHLVSEYEVDHLGFEADTGLLPAITRAIQNGHSLDSALNFYTKSLRLSTKQKEALKLAYELYIDTSMDWREKQSRMSLLAGQLEVSESIQAVFGQCDELKFHAYDMNNYGHYMQNEVVLRKKELGQLKDQMEKNEANPSRYCALQNEFIQTRSELYDAYISDRNKHAISKAHAVNGSTSISFGAAHVRDQISIAQNYGKVVEVRTHGIYALGESDPFNGTESKFNEAYPVSERISCQLVLQQ